MKNSINFSDFYVFHSMFDKNLPQMQMSHAPENTAVWLPQSAVHTDFSVPPDVIPIYQQPNKDYWSTLPSKMSRSKSLKQPSMGSTDSGVSLASNHKDHIELTKTVKHCLNNPGN